MVKFSVEMKKRDLVWVGLFVVLLSVGFGIAFGGNQPDVMGHSAGEVMVNIGGVDKGLQSAIDAGDFDGGGEVKMTSGMYLGDKTVNRPIAHGLGVVPKLVIINYEHLLNPYVGGAFFHIYDQVPRIFEVDGNSDASYSVNALDSTNFYVGYPSEMYDSANTDANYYWIAFG